MLKTEKAKKVVYAEPTIEIEAPRTIQKEIDLRSRQRIRLHRRRIKNIARAFGVVVGGHRDFPPFVFKKFHRPLDSLFIGIP
jgi:hypothetical protein